MASGGPSGIPSHTVSSSVDDAEDAEDAEDPVVVVVDVEVTGADEAVVTTTTDEHPKNRNSDDDGTRNFMVCGSF